jgi:beta-lactamase regulating signal transducer with metallopeptidase domain
MNDAIGLIIGFILTLLIYSYLIGDNPLFRLAVHILVGVSGAYAGVVVLRQVILPVFARLAANPASINSLLWLVPILLALLLILQRLPGFSWLGDNALALLVGVGSAVALVGAITGTLLPQILDFGSQTETGPIEGIIVAALTVCVLLAFYFTGRKTADGVWQRPVWLRGIVPIGKAVLTITFGFLFAAILSTSLILLTERIDFYFTLIKQLLS